MVHHINEKILLYRIRKGDAESFGPIYDHFNEKLYRFIYLKVPTAQDAEDLSAETFLKLWQYIRDTKHIKNLQALLYQIARNIVVDFYRKRGAALVESIDDKEIIIADRSDLTLEEKMVLKSDMAHVELALRKIKDGYREVIVMHFLNEFSLKEIAEILEKSHGAVRVLLHRGMKTLKTILESERGNV